ncbi:MAG: CocE/NonD family hydrolase C-terminal non-catalytic domain-containing protein [Acidimicrobiia bacterium]
MALQKRFFDHYLKPEGNGWDDQPRVQLRIRHVDGSFTDRAENEWPMARTIWTRYHLGGAGELASTSSPSSTAVEYDAGGDGVTFSTPPLPEEMEVTGALAAKLFVSSATVDADLFLVVRVFDPEDQEVTFMGALDPNTPVAQGWLRASHRALDPEKSLPYRPYHPHTLIEPLTPGQIYELEVEIWPTSVVIPAGYRLALTIRGNDYRYEGELSEFARRFHYAGRGVGPFKHADPEDRPPEIFAGVVTLHLGGDTDSHLLVPVVP